MIDSFNSGYTKALIDVENYFSNHSPQLKSCKLYNEKGIQKLLHELINHREELRETGDCILKYNTETKSFVD